jgi:hypothetical protein
MRLLKPWEPLCVKAHTSLRGGILAARTLKDEVIRLRAENVELRTLVAQLQEQLGVALARIAELEQQRRDPPSFVKPNQPKPNQPKPPRKKRDARHNKARRHERPTRIVEHALAACPDCAYPLRGHSLDYSRQVIALAPPPPVEVVEHRVIKRWCPACRRWHHPRLTLSGQVLGRGRIGVRLASLISLLRTTMRLPLAAIRRSLRSVHQLTLSVGGIQEILTWHARGLNPFEQCLTLLSQPAAPAAESLLPRS